MQVFNRRLAGFTGLEWIVIAAIIAVLIALLSPQTQWWSDGSIRLPVRVIVVDADGSSPIANAKIAVFRGPMATDPHALDEMRADLVSNPISNRPPRYVATTDENGSTVIEFEFYTSASHKRPTRHAFLQIAWVGVEAQGFGGAVVPVRHESQSVAVLLKQGEIVVQVALSKVAQ